MYRTQTFLTSFVCNLILCDCDSRLSSNYKCFSKTFLGDDRESWMWSSSGSAMSPETGSWQGCQHEKNLASSWVCAGGKFGTPLSSVRSQLCMHRKGFAGTQVLFFLSSLLQEVLKKFYINRLLLAFTISHLVFIIYNFFLNFAQCLTWASSPTRRMIFVDSWWVNSEFLHHSSQSPAKVRVFKSKSELGLGPSQILTLNIFQLRSQRASQLLRL